MDLEKIQRDDESTKAPEANVSDTMPTKEAILPETSSAPTRDLVPLQEPPLPSHTQSDTATPSLPADISASPAKLSPSGERKEVSNVELAENIEALVEPQPTLKEDSPATDLEKTQHYDGSVKAPEAHVPDTMPTRDAILPETSHAPSSHLIPVQEPPLPSHTQSDRATPSLPADIPASPAKLSPSGERKEEVSNVELAENIEALVEPQPTLREDSPSPMADQEKIQRCDGSAKAPEPHAPDTTSTKDAVLPETSHAPSTNLIPVQEPPLPSHTQSDTATPSLPADIPASAVKFSPSGEKKGDISNVVLAENIEALVDPQPTLREDSPAADLEWTQHDDGSAKAPEPHAPGNYRHNEDTTPTKDAILPETSSAPCSNLIPVQKSPLPSHTRSDTATPSLPADIPASPAELTRSEKEAITQHYYQLIKTISNDMAYFSGKFIENGFITLEVSSDTCGMKGVGGREMAETLLNKVMANLTITRDRKKWFEDFVTIFSVEATYKPLAERMMQTYQSATPSLPADIPASPTKLSSSGERKGEVSNVELAKNVKALVEPQPTLREDSPAAGLKKTQRDDGSALAPESHSPGKSKEIDEAKEEVKQLEKKFDARVLSAQDDMIHNKVEVRHLRHSIIRLPRDLKSEHHSFLSKKVKKKLEKAKTIEAIFLIVDDYWNFLNYSLLEHIIDRNASDDIKKEMAEYIAQVSAFRRKTRLDKFSKIYKRNERKVDETFRTLVTEHDIHLSTTTLETVEEIRHDICSELSLEEFSLQLAAVAPGSLVITWLVPQSLVAYIQKSVKLSSPAMRKHHVSQLTIDGLIVYDNTIAMQNEHKVTRLQWQAINVNYSYLLDEMAPDELVPHLVARRLLTQEKAKEVSAKSDRLQKITLILEALRLQLFIVGMLPTFCAALLDTGQPTVAERLTTEFCCLLEGQSPSISPNEDDIMISGEESAQPSPPPPGSCLITAQVEGTTLARARYTRIASLMSSLLCLLSRALVYVGHTLHPLTLHWHCSAAERGDNDPEYSIGILSAMAQEGIIQINDGKMDSVIPRRNEMRLFECAWDGDVEGIRHVMDTGVQVDIQRPDGMTALMCASLNGHVEVVDTLLQHGARVDSQMKVGWTALMYASQNGHAEVVDTLLQHGARVDLQNNVGRSALMYASQNGHAEVVDTLLQHGARVDLQNNVGGTALMIAFQNGHAEVVDTLLQHGASVHLQSNNGSTALMIASRNGQHDVVDTLLQRGASVDLQNTDGGTALIISSQCGHVEVVDTLLQHGARVDLQMKDGGTALIISSQNGHAEVVNTLLQHGARVDLQMKNGVSTLMIASHNGRVEVVNTLLQHEASVDLKDENGCTALMIASQEGHVEVVDTLLQHGARVDLQKKNGRTALMIASLNGHVEVVNTLLQHGASVDLKEEDGWSALILASQNGYVDVVDTLLQWGAGVDLQSTNGVTALMIASQIGHVEVVNTLLQHEASVDLKEKDGGIALMIASQCGHVEVVDTLLQHGARVDLQMKNGQTALMIASVKGHVEVVNTLLQHEASVDLKEEDGFTALMIASQNRCVEMVNTLLQHGARVDLQRKNGVTALMSASQNGHVEVGDTLLRHGASVDLQDNDGFTAMMIASQYGHADVVDTLLQHGARVDLQRKNGWTALMSASWKGHVDVVDRLVQHGAKVDWKREDGGTALMLASLSGHAEVVDTLLQHGASVDLQDNNGVTALMLASLSGHTEVVDTLLQHAASVDLQDNNGVTALMIASRNGHVMVLDTLLKHGASVDFKREANATVLMVVIYHGLSGVVEALLRAKPDVNITATGREDLNIVRTLLKLEAKQNMCTQEGQTPLLLAVRKRNIAIARELLGAGADPNHIQEGGLSALMLCCEEGNSEMAELLLISQADPNLQQSGTGFTALMFACKGGHLDTVFTLLGHNANTAIRNRDGMTAADLASINEQSEIYVLLELTAPQTKDSSQGLEYPDNRPMEEDVEQLITRFHNLMDHKPLPRGDCDKSVAMPESCRDWRCGKDLKLVEMYSNNMVLCF